MMTIPERYRLPLVAVASLVVAVLVVGAILLVGGSPQPSGSPSPTPASLSPSPTDPGSTPESATRAFFAAFGRARGTDDPSIVRPYVTSEESDAYRSVRGFLDGQRSLNKATVITAQRFDNLDIQLGQGTATVSFTFVEAGYDIDLGTGQPRESPIEVPPFQVTVELRQEGSTWLVDAYESQQ